MTMRAVFSELLVGIIHCLPFAGESAKIQTNKWQARSFSLSFARDLLLRDTNFGDCLTLTSLLHLLLIALFNDHGNFYQNRLRLRIGIAVSLLWSLPTVCHKPAQCSEDYCQCADILGLTIGCITGRRQNQAR